MQESRPEAAPAVSLSQADPVVQPSASPAGAIGRSDALSRNPDSERHAVAARQHEPEAVDQNANGAVYPQRAHGQAANGKCVCHYVSEYHDPHRRIQ